MLMRKGFTLAEVLITIGIIGIVAEITIPSLVNNIQDQAFKTQMKKDYSVLASAFQLVANENGGRFADAMAGCGATDPVCFKNVFKSKLSYLKQCDYDGVSDPNECFLSNTAGIKYLNGTLVPETSAYYIAMPFQTAGLILKDGSALLFFIDSPSCDVTRGNASYHNSCGFIVVDVNSPKRKPNTWGRDFYLFFVLSDRILPASVASVESIVTTSDDCGTGVNYGITCASKYLIGN